MFSTRSKKANLPAMDPQYAAWTLYPPRSAVDPENMLQVVLGVLATWCFGCLSASRMDPRETNQTEMNDTASMLTHS